MATLEFLFLVVAFVFLLVDFLIYTRVPVEFHAGWWRLLVLPGGGFVFAWIARKWH